MFGIVEQVVSLGSVRVFEMHESTLKRVRGCHALFGDPLSYR